MASRQRWRLTRYILVAVPLVLITLYLSAPSIPVRSNWSLQDLRGGSVKPPPDVTVDDIDAEAEEIQALLEADAKARQPSLSSTPSRASASSAPPSVASSASPAPEVKASGDSKASPAGNSGASAAGEFSSSTPSPVTGFDKDRWWFQGDLDDYPLPNFDIEKLRYLAPHNYRGRHHETFATFYATRNATLQEPYFLAALQIVYRLLWKDGSKSKHPVTVFVPPHVSDTHRKYFAAAGALVRQVDLLPFSPDHSTQARWIDVFSKLEMWRQTDFSRIVFLDCDAFPMANTDKILEVAREQTCKTGSLSTQDKTFANTMCKYTFAAAQEYEMEDSANRHKWFSAAVMVFSPDRGMYDRLLRGVQDREHWDTTMLEQAMLNYVYKPDGPFPYQSLPDVWLCPSDFRDQGKDYNIVHDKMWGHYFEPGLWVLENYKNTWAEMKKFYESDEFMKVRMEDQKRAMEGLD